MSPLRSAKTKVVAPPKVLLSSIEVSPGADSFRSLGFWEDKRVWGWTGSQALGSNLASHLQVDVFAHLLTSLTMESLWGSLSLSASIVLGEG